MKSLTARLNQKMIEHVDLQLAFCLLVLMFYLSHRLRQRGLVYQSSHGPVETALLNDSMVLLADIFLRQTLIVIVAALIIAAIIQ